MDERQETGLIAIFNFLLGMFASISGAGWFLVDRPKTAVLNILGYWLVLAIEAIILLGLIVVWIVSMFLISIGSMPEAFPGAVAYSIISLMVLFVMFAVLSVLFFIINVLINLYSSYEIYETGREIKKV